MSDIFNHMRTIKIYMNDRPIGAIAALTLMPNSTDVNPTFNISRVRFDTAQAAQLFTNGQVQVMTQVYPFHIVLADDDVEVGRATNVWINSMGYSYTCGGWTIVDSMEAISETAVGIASNSSNNLPTDQTFEPLEPVK